MNIGQRDCGEVAVTQCGREGSVHDPVEEGRSGGSAALISTVGAQEMQKAEMAGLCVLSSAPKRLLPQSVRLSAAIGALEANERLRCKEGRRLENGLNTSGTQRLRI